VKKLHESFLQKLRVKRGEEIDALKKQKDHAFKDQIFLLEKEVQALFVKQSAELDKLTKTKEKEILNA